MSSRPGWPDYAADLAHFLSIQGQPLLAFIALPGEARKFGFAGGQFGAQRGDLRLQNITSDGKFFALLLQLLLLAQRLGSFASFLCKAR